MRRIRRWLPLLLVGVTLLGVRATSRMALEARTRSEGVVQMGRFLERTHNIRHSVTRCQEFDDHFVCDRGTDVTINAFDVLVPSNVVRCGEGDPLPLHRMELGKFFFVEMAGSAERVVLLQVVSNHNTPTKRYRPEQGDTHQEER